MKTTPRKGLLFATAGALTAAACLGVSVDTAFAIQGGSAANSGEQPWYVGILMTGEASPIGRLVCGGTLVAPDRVLTAGHCVDGAAPADLTVRTGADVLSGPGRDIPVRRIATHAGYGIQDGENGIRRVHNDVAVIELSEPIAGQVLPIALTPPPPDTPVTAFGHGNTGPRQDKSDTLQQAALTILPTTDCTASMAGHFLFEPDQQLCVGPPGPATTNPAGQGTMNPAGLPAANPAEPTTVKPCSADSGGPLVAGSGPDARLVGIAGYVDRQAACDDPTARLTAYADAARFRDWALAPDPVWAPRPLADAVVTGDPHPGGELTCQNPVWDGNPDSVGYSWLATAVGADGVPQDIPLATATDRASITVPDHVAGHTIACLVTASNQGGTASSAAVVDVVSAPARASAPAEPDSAAPNWLLGGGILTAVAVGTTLFIRSRRD